MLNVGAGVVAGHQCVAVSGGLDNVAAVGAVDDLGMNCADYGKDGDKGKEFHFTELVVVCLEFDVFQDSHVDFVGSGDHQIK